MIPTEVHAQCVSAVINGVLTVLIIFAGGFVAGVIWKTMRGDRE